MTSFKYFVNISVKISPNSNKLDSLKNYTKRAVEKSVPIWLSDYISTCWEISVSLLAVFVPGGGEGYCSQVWNIPPVGDKRDRWTIVLLLR